MVKLPESFGDFKRAPHVGALPDQNARRAVPIAQLKKKLASRIPPDRFHVEGHEPVVVKTAQGVAERIARKFARTLPDRNSTARRGR